MNLPVSEQTFNSCRTSNRGFALAEDLVSLLKKVQIEYRVAVSLGSFIRQAIDLRESWISEVCARGRLCKPPDHWSRNFIFLLHWLHLFPLSGSNLRVDPDSVSFLSRLFEFA